jgi:hypothetical protein
MNWNRHVAAAARTVVVLVLAPTLHASSLTAQEPFGPPAVPEFSLGDQLSLGLTAGVSIPRGPFAEFAGLGFELKAHVLVVNRAGWLGLRVSGSGVFFREADSPLYGGRSLSVRNRMGALDLGPQVIAPTGRVRPYGYGTIGGVFVLTDSSLDGLTTFQSYDPVFSEVARVVTLGGGMYVPLTEGSRSVALDFGAQYRWNGGTRFLDGGGINFGSLGQPGLDPIAVSPRLLVLSLGVEIGL